MTRAGAGGSRSAEVDEAVLEFLNVVQSDATVRAGAMTGTGCFAGVVDTGGGEVAPVTALEAALDPMLLMARMVNEYMVLMASPLIVHDNVAVVQRNRFPAWLATTEYEVIARPPFDTGAAQVMVAAEAVVATRLITGAPGIFGMVYVVDADTDAPTVLFADTDTDSAEPMVRPLMEHERANALAGTQEPIELVTEYD